jgi:uncharacterized protein YuzE
MTLKVDEKADALYLRLDDSKIIESEEVSPGVILDFNADNQVVGVEILHLSKRSPKLDAFARSRRSLGCGPSSNWPRQRSNARTLHIGGPGGAGEGDGSFARDLKVC